MTDGQATVDAEDLGPLLGIEPAAVPQKMRSGQITSLFETGIDEDAGRYRLTFFYDNRRIRLTCAADGTVLSTIRTPVGKQT
ncbi:DUF6522 family protein [Sulfitobacter sp. F26169L]|uniref:DUF6522 family protein n=1 Tax=Sulfitobacter sp. F26169L TaxID=2996015 RepID=UPI002260F544|nr:DUF6522 family protein [Sulfitobacter sp. F26169L]MCX7566158.1 DUF6522 family protein [Sulfitobacter sp. F26169L]